MPRIDSYVECTDENHLCLTAHMSPPYGVILNCYRVILGLIAQGEAIQAIKAIRHYYGWDLKESKDFFDQIRDTVGASAITQQNNLLRDKVARLNQRTAALETDLRNERNARRKTIEDTWQEKLRREAESRRAGKLLSSVAPAAVGPEVAHVRKLFEDRFAELSGHNMALSRLFQATGNGILKLLENHEKKPYTSDQWMKGVLALSGVWSSIENVWNSLDKAAKDMHGDVLGWPDRDNEKALAATSLLQILQGLGMGTPASQKLSQLIDPRYDATRTPSNPTGATPLSSPTYPFKKPVLTPKKAYPPLANLGRTFGRY